jgi:hypothetical protein
MDASTLFSICNNAILPFWALLVLAPGWLWTQRLVHSALVPALFSIVYAGALLAAEAPADAGMGTLAGVMGLFSVPEAALAGWVHYLVFDLFVGAWEVRDARRLGIPHLAIVPAILLTLALGPVGLALYLAIRAALRRTSSLVEEPAAAT